MWQYKKMETLKQKRYRSSWLNSQVLNMLKKAQTEGINKVFLWIMSNRIEAALWLFMTFRILYSFFISKALQVFLFFWPEILSRYLKTSKVNHKQQWTGRLFSSLCWSGLSLGALVSSHRGRTDYSMCFVVDCLFVRGPVRDLGPVQGGGFAWGELVYAPADFRDSEQEEAGVHNG